MDTIFDLVVAPELSAYWQTLTADRTPFLGEELFPPDKKLGLELDWIKGSKGLPVVLKPSAFDVNSTIRDRIGFEKLTADMPFFKESMLIDEKLRQELNRVLETGNEAYIESVLSRVFDDNIQLLEGASAQRERMRMMMLTTGVINIEANGQTYYYDYKMPAENKVTVSKSWADPTADIIEDIRLWQEQIEDATGVKPTRALSSRKTAGYLMKNDGIKKAIYTSGIIGHVNETRLKQFLQDEFELSLVINNKRYKNEDGETVKYVPDDTFVMFPEGELGKTWFGTTPEESDLMTSKVANVSIVDKGVAICTSHKIDPVNVDTKVSQIVLPSFETADQVIIADVVI